MIMIAWEKAPAVSDCDFSISLPNEKASEMLSFYAQLVSNSVASWEDILRFLEG